jgi:DNA-binding IscR family transcriptional regulator
LCHRFAVESATAHEGWFAIGVHALALPARTPGTTPSAHIAGSVNTHAVSLRRVVVRFVRAGLVISHEGRDGGYRLARPAAEITLADVYRALRAAGPLPPSSAVPNPQCPVGSGIRAALGEVADEAERRLLDDLAGHTIAEVSGRAVALGAHPDPA